MPNVYLDDFDLPRKVKILFKAKMWTEGQPLIYNLEKYKFVSRDKIISVMKEKGFTNLISVKSVNSSTSSLSVGGFESFIKNNDLILNVREDSEVEYIANVFSSAEAEVLSVQSPITDFTLVYITPYNWQELTNIELMSWDYGMLFRRLVLECIEKKGRDIHISVAKPNGVPTAIVQYRCPSGLYRSELFDLTPEDNIHMIQHVVSADTGNYVGDLNSIHGTLGSIQDVFGDNAMTIRMSSMKVEGGFRAVGRIQESSTTTLAISELGFSEKVQEDLRFIAQKRGGLTMVTGAINTGKNTTMFSVANHMAYHPDYSILSITHPVETWMPFSQLDYQGNLDYLRNMVKLCKTQDLNMALIGEIPDREVARSVIDLVNSSVHVLSTFHINRVWHLPYKMEEYFGEDFRNVLSQLNGCFTQKMFTTICPYCRNKTVISNLPERIKKKLEDFNIDFYYTNTGCDKCHESVRIQPYVEHFVMDEDLLHRLLRCEKTYDMENVIKEHVTSTKAALEYSVLRDVGEGILPAHSVMQIL